jgi:multiple sugar transport system permease protein
MATKSLSSSQVSGANQWLAWWRGRQAEPLYFLLPTILPLLVLTLYPFLRSIWLAFTGYDLYKKDSSFIGLRNFIALLGDDPLFWLALRNTIAWTILIVGISYLLGLMTALALNERIWFRTLFRGIALIPWVCPAVVAGITWRWIYEPNFGPLVYYLQQWGLLERKMSFLASKETALYAAVVMAVWKLLPFMVVMLLAGLQAVPDEYYEAAAIDGASAWTRFRYITFPLVNRVGSIAFLLSTIWAFNHFDSMYTLTGGGPANATMLLSQFAYENAFRYFQVGYASAIGVMMLIVLATPITLYIRQIFRDTE